MALVAGGLGRAAVRQTTRLSKAGPEPAGGDWTGRSDSRHSASTRPGQVAVPGTNGGGVGRGARGGLCYAAADSRPRHYQSGRGRFSLIPVTIACSARRALLASRHAPAARRHARHTLHPHHLDRGRERARRSARVLSQMTPTGIVAAVVMLPAWLTTRIVGARRWWPRRPARLCPWCGEPEGGPTCHYSQPGRWH